jgi:hypothetical protein
MVTIARTQARPNPIIPTSKLKRHGADSGSKSASSATRSTIHYSMTSKAVYGMKVSHEPECEYITVSRSTYDAKANWK